MHYSRLVGQNRSAIKCIRFTNKGTAQTLAFYSLCIFAIVNPAIAQLSFLLIPDGIAGLSIMQLFQGTLFLIWMCFFACIFSRYKYWLHFRALLIVMILGFFLFYFKTMHDSNWLSQNSSQTLVIFIKPIFWAFSWLFVSMIVQNHLQARKLIICIIFGTACDALFKIWGNLSGQWVVQTYEDAGVIASFGVEGISGKSTVGFLLMSIYLSWYLLRECPWISSFVSLFFIAAIVLTYDRSAQVALIASLSFCLAWAILGKLRHIKRLFPRFVLLFSVFACAYGAIFGIQHIFSRWTYEFGKYGLITGAGRLNFYKTAWEWFLSADTADLLFGQGVESTYAMLYSKVGMRVHTHSDLFDLMSFGGILGIAIYIIIFITIFSLVLRIRHIHIEFPISLALVICFIILSVFTGQLWATHSMFVLGTSLWCLYLGSFAKSHIYPKFLPRLYKTMAHKPKLAQMPIMCKAVPFDVYNIR